MARAVVTQKKRRDLQRWLTLLAILALAQWFFGNSYEAVVISPNWVVDSVRQMTRLNEFFVRANPTMYFVPAVLLAPVLVWVLTALNRDASLRQDYRRASLFALLATALNAYVVATVITKLFGPDYLAHADQLAAYCRRWNVLNVLRMILVATTAVFLFGAFRKLDSA
jgi:hypothetical protein